MESFSEDGLGAKLKLGFIDGILSKPNEILCHLVRWNWCDYMVKRWLLNSVLSEYSQNFLFAQSTLNYGKKLVSNMKEGMDHISIGYNMKARELNDTKVLYEIKEILG